LSRFGILGGVILFILLAVAGLAWLCDFVIRRFDDSWSEGQTEQTFQFNPAGITRQTYVRLLASVPFLFGAGLIAAFVAAVPNSSSGGDVLKSIIPTVTTTFIGSAIALLATACFALYIVKVFEPADADRPNTGGRAPWEMRVPLVALVLAVLASVPLVQPGPAGIVIGDRLTWAAWSLFMLASSLSFAYGLVHHGLFKDLQKSEQRVANLETAIRRRCEPPTIDTIRKTQPRQPRAITRRYLDERFHWEGIARRLRTLHLYGLGIDPSLVQVSSRSPLLKPLSGLRLKTTAVGQFMPLDDEIAKSAILFIEERRLERANTDSEVKTLQLVIEEKGRRASWEELDRLERERTALIADIASSRPSDQALESRSFISEDELILRIKAAISSAIRIRPSFDPIVNDAAHRAMSRGVRFPSRVASQ
jgi:hypothetical protein